MPITAQGETTPLSMPSPDVLGGLAIGKANTIRCRCAKRQIVRRPDRGDR
jgi:hypothetical protein